MYSMDERRVATSPEHHATGKVLKDLVEHHIKEEESVVWSDVKENFSDEERRQMNSAFEAAKAKVRIRSWRGVRDCRRLVQIELHRGRERGELSLDRLPDSDGFFQAAARVGVLRLGPARLRIAQARVRLR